MKELRFVDVGEGITEGHFQKWLVKDGDAVKEDQTIAQIETDKAVVNIPAPASGTIKLAARENSEIKVGDLIATIITPGDTKQPSPSPPMQPQPNAAEAPLPPSKLTAPATPRDAAMRAKPGTSLSDMMLQATPPVINLDKLQSAAGDEKPLPSPSPAPKPQQKEIIATPYVRKMAYDNNIDISKIIGTGPGGRVLENDLKSAMMKGSMQRKPVPKFSEVLEEQHGHDIERVPLSQTRKAIARNMELSWSIPRAVHMDKINATKLWDITTREKGNAAKMGVKLTFLPFIIKAVVQALKQSPTVNASYDHDRQELIVKKYYNIGLAAEAKDGLKVIVIKDADKKGIIDLAKDIQQLHDKILGGTIAIDEMRDSTFTITNIGSLGGGYFSVPMINYPEAAILGVHLIRDEPVVQDGKIVVGKVLPISLSFDHRIFDGAEAAKFANAVKTYIEDPDFLEML